MLENKVLISYEGNIYDGMYGVVIEDHPHAVRVRIDYDNDYDEVLFFIEQVRFLYSGKYD
jgi:hypothetical protein